MTLTWVVFALCLGVSLLSFVSYLGWGPGIFTGDRELWVAGFIFALLSLAFAAYLAPWAWLKVLGVAAVFAIFAGQARYANRERSRRGEKRSTLFACMAILYSLCSAVVLVDAFISVI